MVNVVEEPLVIPTVGPLDTQLDSTELRVVPTVPASAPALRRAGVHLEEEPSDSWTGGRRLSLMSDGVPIVPSNEVRVVHQVEVVAMDVGDTETLVSERSRLGDDDFEPEHESAPEEDELWERNSVASGISDQGIKILGTPLGHHDFVQNFLELPTNINNSWTCCLLCRTCSQVGCFWCIVYRPGQIICCALCALTVSRGLLKHTTEGCGSVCARC